MIFNNYELFQAENSMYLRPYILKKLKSGLFRPIVPIM
jgi:hypothetical protein